MQTRTEALLHYVAEFAVIAHLLALPRLLLSVTMAKVMWNSQEMRQQ